MGLYEKHILPRIVHCVCGLGPMMKQRSKVIPRASGQVLEIGIGSGLNLSFYSSDTVKSIVGVDPYPAKSTLYQSIEQCDIPIDIIEEDIELVSLPSRSFDTIVTSYTLCTIRDPTAALAGLIDTLKDDGKILFIEHGKSDDQSVNKIQDRWNPLWRRIAGGCHLNRNIADVIESSGYHIDEMATMFLPGWKPASYNLWGVARKA